MKDKPAARRPPAGPRIEDPGPPGWGLRFSTMDQPACIASAGPETPLLISEGMLPRVLGIEFPQQGSERECKVVQGTTHRVNGK